MFLTGLQRDFDRQRQLAYLFKRKGAVTVAGGSICTLFPNFAAEFFDVVCAGGVDSVPDVMRDFENGELRQIYVSAPNSISDYRVDYRLLRPGLAPLACQRLVNDSFTRPSYADHDLDKQT